jgi:hypothetical protein
MKTRGVIIKDLSEECTILSRCPVKVAILVEGMPDMQGKKPGSINLPIEIVLSFLSFAVSGKADSFDSTHLWSLLTSNLQTLSAPFLESSRR